MTREQELMIQEAINLLDDGACTCRSFQSDASMGICPTCQAICLLYKALEMDQQKIAA
jgi:hypothetical protein